MLKARSLCGIAFAVAAALLISCDGAAEPSDAPTAAATANDRTATPTATPRPSTPSPTATAVINAPSAGAAEYAARVCDRMESSKWLLLSAWTQSVFEVVELPAGDFSGRQRSFRTWIEYSEATWREDSEWLSTVEVPQPLQAYNQALIELTVFEAGVRAGIVAAVRDATTVDDLATVREAAESLQWLLPLPFLAAERQIPPGDRSFFADRSLDCGPLFAAGPPEEWRLHSDEAVYVDQLCWIYDLSWQTLLIEEVVFEPVARRVETLDDYQVLLPGIPDEYNTAQVRLLVGFEQISVPAAFQEFHDAAASNGVIRIEVQSFGRGLLEEADSTDQLVATFGAVLVQLDELGAELITLRDNETQEFLDLIARHGSRCGALGGLEVDPQHEWAWSIWARTTR